MKKIIYTLLLAASTATSAFANQAVVIDHTGKKQWVTIKRERIIVDIKRSKIYVVLPDRKKVELDLAKCRELLYTGRTYDESKLVDCGK